MIENESENMIKQVFRKPLEQKSKHEAKLGPTSVTNRSKRHPKYEFRDIRGQFFRKVASESVLD